MLMNLNKKSWVDGLSLRDYKDHCDINQEQVAEMLALAKNYDKVRINNEEDSCIYF